MTDASSVFFSLIPAGLSNSDQSFRSWNEQRDGQGRRPHHAFCCAGIFFRFTVLKERLNTRKKKILLSPSTYRWCWSRLCTSLSPCTAAAVCWLPSPRARCQLRQLAAACKSPANASGARRWWAEPPPPARRESRSPAPGHRAENAGRCTSDIPMLRLFSSCTTVAFKEPGSTLLRNIAL